MKVIRLITLTFFIGNSYGAPIIHDIREKLHTKIFGRGEMPKQNSPIVNINNYQEMSQQSTALNRHRQNYQPFASQHSNSGHIRGDYGSLPNYEEHKYGGAFVNSNIKAGGLKYGTQHGGLGYGSYNSVKQESYHHREGPKFGQHYDTNMFGNAQLDSATSSSTSSSSSSSYHNGSSGVSVSSSSSSSGDAPLSSFNARGKPWRH